MLLVLQSTPENKDILYTLNFEVTFKTLFDALIKYLANEYNLNYLKNITQKYHFFNHLNVLNQR